jgi:hypothetical protein
MITPTSAPTGSGITSRRCGTAHSKSVGVDGNTIAHLLVTAVSEVMARSIFEQIRQEILGAGGVLGA